MNKSTHILRNLIRKGDSIPSIGHAGSPSCAGREKVSGGSPAFPSQLASVFMNPPEAAYRMFLLLLSTFSP